METLKYRVLALDLDGTLTNSQKQLTPATISALERAARAGVKIVLASGRPVMGIRPLAGQLRLDKLDGYILAANGAQVVSCRTGEAVYTSAVPQDTIAQMEVIARQYGVALLCYDQQGVISDRPDDRYVRLEAFNNGLSVSYEPHMARRITWPTPKLMMVGEPESLAPCARYARKYFGDRLNVFLSERYFLELTSPGISKSSGLEKLLAHLGETREALMACGDGLNDLDMLAYAGLGVAMANAYPEAKAVAKALTTSNDEDGVAQAVYRYLLDEPFPAFDGQPLLAPDGAMPLA